MLDDSALALRITEWFAEHQGKMVMIDVGTYAPDRDPRERVVLTYMTKLGRNYVSDDFEDPGVIVVNVPDVPGGSIITVPPRQVEEARFDEVGTPSIAIYFEDAGYVSLLAFS